jgi:hypothetical protein
MQIPFSPALEKQMYPNKQQIIAAVLRVTQKDKEIGRLPSIG